MGNVLVIVLGGVALAVAGWIVVDGVHVAAPAVGVTVTARARFQEAVRQLSAMFGAGFVSGLLVTGFGGRLFMRLVGITSDDAAQGRLTEADEVVGEVTFEGSAFLIVFGAGFGLLGAVGLFALRSWLPRRSIVAGLTVAGIGAAALARPTELLDPDSIDFEILGPVWFAVGFAIVLIALLGTTTAVLADRWIARWPAPSWSIRGVCGLAPLVPLILLGPGVVIIPVVLLLRVFAWPKPTGEPATRPGMTLSALTIAAGVAGWAWTLGLSAQILT